MLFNSFCFNWTHARNLLFFLRAATAAMIHKRSFLNVPSVLPRHPPLIKTDGILVTINPGYMMGWECENRNRFQDSHWPQLGD